MHVVHYHRCTAPLIEDADSQLACSVDPSEIWVDPVGDTVIEITARDLHPDDDVIIVGLPLGED